MGYASSTLPITNREETALCSPPPYISSECFTRTQSCAASPVHVTSFLLLPLISSHQSCTLTSLILDFHSPNPLLTHVYSAVPLTLPTTQHLLNLSVSLLLFLPTCFPQYCLTSFHTVVFFFLFPSPLQLSPAQVTLHCCSNYCSACSQQSSTYPFLNWLQLPICSLRLAIISLLHVLCHGVPITICPSPLQITHPSIPPFLRILFL